MSNSLVEIGEGPKYLGHERLPSHCVRVLRPNAQLRAVERRMRHLKLHSVCEEARCPNRGECWERGAITFMLMGEVCTRACRFCAVATGRPAQLPDPAEPERVARLAAELGRKHVVLTSVNRDDLADGGASHFAEAIGALRRLCSGATVEVLTPDFRGDIEAVARVCEAQPDVFNHNVETVPRLYRQVRPGARFARSLDVLEAAKHLRRDAVVKSGLMVGLGETFEEVVALLRTLRTRGVDVVTIGQYLRPSRKHLPVERYWEPEEFELLAEVGTQLGFADVASGPLVRSSYHAEDVLGRASVRRSLRSERSARI